MGTVDLIHPSGRADSTVVLRHDRENATPTVSHLNDSFSAFCAPASRELYQRAERFLYCRAEPERRWPSRNAG